MVKSCEICDIITNEKARREEEEKKRIAQQELENKKIQQDTIIFYNDYLSAYLKKYATKNLRLPTLFFHSDEVSDYVIPYSKESSRTERKPRTKTVYITSYFYLSFADWDDKPIHLPTLIDLFNNDGFSVKKNCYANTKEKSSSTGVIKEDVNTIIHIDFNCPKLLNN